MGMFAVSCLILVGLTSTYTQTTLSPIQQTAVDYAVGLTMGGTLTKVNLVHAPSHIHGGHQYYVSIDITKDNKQQVCNSFLTHSMEGPNHVFKKVTHKCNPKVPK